MSLHDRHISIIQMLLRSFRPVTCKDIRFEMFDFERGMVPTRTIQRDLKTLVRMGLLERIGNARATMYRLSDRAHQDLVDISIAYNRERTEFQKYRSSGIAPRFSFTNMREAVSWMIRRNSLAFDSTGSTFEER